MCFVSDLELGRLWKMNSTVMMDVTVANLPFVVRLYRHMIDVIQQIT